MSTESMGGRFRSRRSCFGSPRRIGAASLLALTALATPAWAQDADGDGVADASDTYPCDPQLAGEVFAPAEGVWAGLMFEDEWPSAGDQDLNDVILDHNTHVRTDAAGGAVRITSRYQVSALGGSARMGLGLHLPVPRSSIAAATITDRNGQRVLTASALDAEATFFAYDDLSTLFPGQTPPFNVVAGGSVVPGQLITIDVTLNTATQVSISAAPFDVFVFRSNDVTRETHRTPYAGTSRLAAILFGTGDDGSAPGRYFVDTQGIPFVLDLPQAGQYPLEQRHVAQLWPNITNFAASAGTTNADFYVSNVQAASRFAARVFPQAIAPVIPNASCLSPGSFPGPETYNNLFHVAVNGSDTAGNGSAAAPFATPARAITAASAGDGVYIGAGTYHLPPVVHYPGFMTAGIYDQSKRLTIFGANEATILQIFGADSNQRDAHAFSLKGTQTINGQVRGSVVSNLTVHFYPNRSTNYSNALVGWNSTGAEFRNVWFENRSTTHAWAYVYDNINPADTPRFINSVFVSNGRWQSSYTGRPSYTNCLMENAPHTSYITGNLVYDRFRAVTAADRSRGTLPSDLIGTGNPAITNPDGSRSHLGVFGGLYAWP